MSKPANMVNCILHSVGQTFTDLYNEKHSPRRGGYSNAEESRRELQKTTRNYFLLWLGISLAVGCPIIHWVKWYPWWIAGVISFLFSIATYFAWFNGLETEGPGKEERVLVRQWKRTRRRGLSSGVIDHLTVKMSAYSDAQFTDVINGGGFMEFLRTNTLGYLSTIAHRMRKLESEYRGMAALEMEGSEFMPACTFAEDLGIQVNRYWREAIVPA